MSIVFVSGIVYCKISTSSYNAVIGEHFNFLTIESAGQVCMTFQKQETKHTCNQASSSFNINMHTFQLFFVKVFLVYVQFKQSSRLRVKCVLYIKKQLAFRYPSDS